MSMLDNQTREVYGPPPSDDPVVRALHVIRVFTESTNDSHVVMTATSRCYDAAPWTGMTFGDLKVITHLAEQAAASLEIINEVVAKLNLLGAPRRVTNPDGSDGASFDLVGRVEALLSGRFQPRRDDAVARWLKRARDKQTNSERPDFPKHGMARVMAYEVIDSLLDRYRECSDFNLSLEPEDDDAETYP